MRDSPYLTRNKKKPNPYGLDFFLFGGAEGNLRSLSRLTALLRTLSPFRSLPRGGKNVSPTHFCSPFDSLQIKIKKPLLCGSFILVEPRGIEPLSENRFTVLSPSAAYLWDSPLNTPTGRRIKPVASLVHGRAQSFAQHTFTAK